MDNAPATGSSPDAPSLPRLALGLFIVIQLAFIVFANVGTISLFLANAGNPAAAIAWRGIGAVTEPYALATGQEQYWRMFAPSVPPRAIFVRLKLHLNDGSTQIVPSEFEAVDEPILHLPGSGERLWHVEKNLALPFTVYDREAILAKPEEWRDFLQQKIGADQHRYRAFMDRKMMDHLGNNRNLKQIELLVSIHTKSRHDRPSTQEFEEPVVRWSFGSDALDLCSRTPAGIEWRRLDK